MNKINTLVLIVSAMTSLLLGCTAHLTPRTHTDRTGVILVEEPEVFTRERLVQDRRDQATWLEAQLKKSHGDIDFGFQGSSDVRRSRSIGFSTAVDLDPEGYTRTEEESQLESSDVQALGGAAGLDLPDTASLVQSKAKSSPIDSFRDALAYRDVIRNELLESQLDDRFDIHGNTLYLLNFDATVFPTHDTSSYAVIRVTARSGLEEGASDIQQETYKAWLAWLRGRMQSELTDYLFDVRPGLENLYAGTAASTASIDALESLADFAARNLWPRKTNDERSESSTVDSAEACMTIQEQTADTSSRETVSGWFRQLNQLELGKDEKEKKKHRKLLAKNVELLATCWRGVNRLNKCKGCSPQEMVGFLAAYDWLERRLNSSGLQQQLERSLKEYEESKPGETETTDDADFRAAITIIRKGTHIEKMFLLPRFQRGWNDNNILIEENNLFTNYYKGPLGDVFYKILVDRDYQTKIWTYAVTPKEQVERISDVAARRELRELLISSSLRTGKIGTQQAFKLLDQAQAIWHSILRQPLVIGFGESSVPSGSHDNDVEEGEKDKYVASFGWIIGPRFEIQDDGKSADFRQRPIQNSLSAIVSVPAWWARLELIVETAWVGPNTRGIPEEFPYNDWWPGVHNTGVRIACCDWQRKISIPPDLFTIDELITRPDFLGARPPLLTSVTPKLPRIVKSGARASFILKGDSLWRNTEVTLGAQRAETVRLVPDMSAVEATFKKVADPAGKESVQRDLILWTSAGSSWAGKVLVKQGNPAPKKPLPIFNMTARTNQVIRLEIEHSTIAPGAITDIEIGSQSATNMTEISQNAIKLKKLSVYKAKFEPLQDPGAYVKGKAELDITVWYKDKDKNTQRKVFGKAHVYPGPTKETPRVVPSSSDS